MKDRTLGYHMMWTIIGMVSIFPCFYFWGAWVAPTTLGAGGPGDINFMLFGMLLGLPLSIFAAIRWSKWMYLLAFINLSTLLFVGLRLH